MKNKSAVCAMERTAGAVWPQHHISFDQKNIFDIFRFYMYFKFDNNLFLCVGGIRWNKATMSIFLS